MYNRLTLFFRKLTLVKYVIVGLIATGTNLGVLFLFTDILGVWYIYSSVISFIVAVIISFTLQKFWTFNDTGVEKVKQQFVLFVLTALIGLCLNSVLMYIFVEYIGLWYILTQLIVAVFIAIFNFFMYKFFVFKKKLISEHE